MWLSRKIAAETEKDAGTDGIVSVSGQSPAAVLDGEMRELSVLSPGGYFWCPGVNDEVSVLQGQILGKKQGPVSLQPGEILISSGKASLRLTADGKILLSGDVYINGERWDS